MQNEEYRYTIHKTFDMTQFGFSTNISTIGLTNFIVIKTQSCMTTCRSLEIRSLFFKIIQKIRNHIICSTLYTTIKKMSYHAEAGCISSELACFFNSSCQR